MVNSFSEATGGVDENKFTIYTFKDGSYSTIELDGGDDGVNFNNNTFTITGNDGGEFGTERGGIYLQTGMSGISSEHIVGIEIKFHSEYSVVLGDSLFEGCINLQSLIFNAVNVTLGENCFSHAGGYVQREGPDLGQSDDADGEGVIIFYKYAPTSNSSPNLVHSMIYKYNAFSGAYINEILVPSSSINLTRENSDGDYYNIKLQTPSYNVSFFGNLESFGKQTIIPVTISTQEPNPCFVAGTIIKTDQGNIAIEKVTTSNTIRGIPVCRVTKNLSKNNLVLIKKDAFGVNRPNKDTLVTHWHGVYLKDSDKEFVRLIDLVDNKKVIEQYYKFEYVYNIELKDKHSYMYANNLKVETLIPGHA